MPALAGGGGARVAEPKKFPMSLAAFFAPQKVCNTSSHLTGEPLDTTALPVSAAKPFSPESEAAADFAAATAAAEESALQDAGHVSTLQALLAAADESEIQALALIAAAHESELQAQIATDATTRRAAIDDGVSASRSVGGSPHEQTSAVDTNGRARLAVEDATIDDATIELEDGSVQTTRALLVRMTLAEFGDEELASEIESDSDDEAKFDAEPDPASFKNADRIPATPLVDGERPPNDTRALRLRDTHIHTHDALSARLDSEPRTPLSLAGGGASSGAIVYTPGIDSSGTIASSLRFAPLELTEIRREYPQRAPIQLSGAAGAMLFAEPQHNAELFTMMSGGLAWTAEAYAPEEIPAAVPGAGGTGTPPLSPTGHGGWVLL
jgi:hypothetical protein